MNDEKLAKISLALSILLFITVMFTYKSLVTVDIGDINEGYVGKYVCVYGNVSILKKFNKCMLLNITDGKSWIKGFTCSNVSIHRSTCFVCGSVKRYGGSLEITVKSVECK
jgi:hypothetical protein